MHLLGAAVGARRDWHSIEPAVAGYTSGQLPLVSVIEAVQALWRVQSDLIAADTELGLAWARLGRAVGSYEGILR